MAHSEESHSRANKRRRHRAALLGGILLSASVGVIALVALKTPKGSDVHPLASAGCHRPTEPEWFDNQIYTIETADGPRRFRLRVHGSVGLAHASPLPLVVVFHSYGYDMEFVREWSLWDSYARASSEPMVLLYPDGSDDSLRTLAPGSKHGINSLAPQLIITSMPCHLSQHLGRLSKE